MDSLHAIGFYVSATLLLGAALLVAFLPRREWLGLAMAAVGVGLAGLDFSLSAGLAGTVALACYLAIALLFAGRGYRNVQSGTGVAWRQFAALGAAGFLALAAYAAYRGDFVHATFYGGAFGVSAIGRLLFTHDALSTESVGALMFIALIGATAMWRIRERGR